MRNVIRILMWATCCLAEQELHKLHYKEVLWQREGVKGGKDMEGETEMEQQKRDGCSEREGCGKKKRDSERKLYRGRERQPDIPGPAELCRSRSEPPPETGSSLSLSLSPSVSPPHAQTYPGWHTDELCQCFDSFCQLSRLKTKNAAKEHWSERVMCVLAGECWQGSEMMKMRWLKFNRLICGSGWETGGELTFQWYDVQCKIFYGDVSTGPQGLHN